MEVCADFLERLGPDASTTVLMLLDDPADLVRVSAVSRSWRRFGEELFDFNSWFCQLIGC